jgi:hypothetical protein
MKIKIEDKIHTSLPDIWINDVRTDCFLSFRGSNNVCLIFNSTYIHRSYDISFYSFYNAMVYLKKKYEN